MRRALVVAALLTVTACGDNIGNQDFVLRAELRAVDHEHASCSWPRTMEFDFTTAHYRGEDRPWFSEHYLCQGSRGAVTCFTYGSSSFLGRYVEKLDFQWDRRGGELAIVLNFIQHADDTYCKFWYYLSEIPFTGAPALP